MQTQPFSTEHLDYLQRIGIIPEDISKAQPVVSVPIERRRLLRVDGVGRLEKALVPEVEQGKQPVRQQSEDILIGLYGYRIPVAFYVRGDPEGVAIHIGLWESTAQGQSPLVTLDGGQNVLRGVLHGLYPAIELAPVAAKVSILPKSGFVLGIPTVKSPDPSDGALPLDRLIRALAGTQSQWAFLVLAEPVPDHITSKLQQTIIFETRTVHAATKGAGAPNPLAEYYTELLKTGLASLTQGQGVGTWRTGVYLLGEHDSYYRLASVWRSIFSGEKSQPEPIRIWDNVSTGSLSVNWAMPNILEQEGPGQYRHPFQFQTLLNSSQLAAYVHMPRLETSGFAIRTIPDFDVVPQQRKGNESIFYFSLGNVFDRMLETKKPYEVNAKALTRHVFVAGVTGAGKTNTVFHLLKQAWAMKVPFLVIEPVKTEYRALLNDARIANDVRIFTLGDENISPFRLNPFEVLSGTPISVHLDLLRSAFNASFGMWSPLPQVLEQCLHRIYEDRGWDIARSTNHRLDAHADAADAFPTLSNLVAKVDEVTRELGYEDKITADIRAALHTRLNALRAGGKGFMLDVQRSLPMKELLEHPTILELERMGDDDDRAFMMGLLLIRLAEYRRATGQANGLKHVLVIEEAHRLLTNVGQRQSEEEANPRGKAVEAFANLLSEIRAYGQGVIVADQVPVKLAPDVIKNTNLKIVHRIVAEDDRTVLAGSMVMNERQKKSLATLIPGQAVVFSEGDDAAMLVQIPPIKDDSKPWPDRKRIIQHMASTKALQSYQALFLPFPSCASTCLTKGQACQAAQQIVEDPTFQGTFARTVLSTIEDTGALDRMWEDLLSVVQAKRPPKSNEQDLLRCTQIRASHWFASRRGTQAGWFYAQTKMFAEKLYQMLLAKLHPAANQEPTRSAFQQYARTLHARSYPPFPACELICQQNPPVCLYRYAAADLITLERYSAEWQAADANDTDSQDDRRQQSWVAAQDAGYDLIEFPDPDWPDQSLKQRVDAAVRRTCLCFAQQMLVADVSKIPRTIRIILVKLQKEAQ